MGATDGRAQGGPASPGSRTANPGAESSGMGSKPSAESPSRGQPGNPPASSAETAPRPGQPADATRGDRRGAAEQGTNGRAGSREQTGSINRDVNISSEQRTHITRSFSSMKVEPTTNVNFTVSAGTVVPRTVELHAVPPEIVQIVPAWRRYRYIVVQDEIVIIEPGTRRIVTVIERTG